MEAHNYKQDNYTEVSDNAYWLSNYGINFPYPEKAKAGITIYGEEDQNLYKKEILKEPAEFYFVWCLKLFSYN